jgi:CubicO group peptidase (beta-lactamase class C family)
MALAARGLLDLDAPVGGYLTRWALPESGFDPGKVTARRLLSHTAGLVDDLGYAGFAPHERPQSLLESLDGPADPVPGAGGAIRVGFEPGSAWRYSGGGYAILQLLVEEVSGEPLEAFMRRTVFIPLGMTRSTYEASRAAGSGLAAPVAADGQPAAHRTFAAPAAAALYSSAADLARFLQAHLHGPRGEPPGRGVLPPEAIREMFRPIALSSGQAIWGLGVALHAPNRQAGYIVGHDGRNLPAIGSAARLDPATGNGMLVLAIGRPALAPRLAAEWVLWQTGSRPAEGG